MSSKSLNLRFTAVFTGIFIIGAILLSVITYAVLDNSMRRDDYSQANAKLLEFWAIYRTGGLGLLRNELSLEKMVLEDNLYMLRVASKYNSTLFLFLPANWISYGPSRLESLTQIREGEIIRLPSQTNRTKLEIASLSLPDGNILQVGVSTKRRMEALARYRRIFIIVFLPLSALSLFGGFLFSSRSLKPIRQLIEVTRTIIDTGKTNTRIPSRGSGDELDELVTLFNKALARIDTLITGMRHTLTNAAHDLRTPLTHLRGTAELAMQKETDVQAYRTALISCVDESERMLTMLSTLMDISEAETGVMRLDKKQVNLTELLEDMVELYSYGADEKNIALSLLKVEDAVISADVNRMRQVITNLLDNAIKYTASGGNVTVSMAKIEGKVTIAVADTGTGISPEDLIHIWERLYRGSNSRSLPGLGLGLGLVRAILGAHGGEVTVESELGKGSVFTIILPV